MGIGSFSAAALGTGMGIDTETSDVAALRTGMGLSSFSVGALGTGMGMDNLTLMALALAIGELGVGCEHRRIAVFEPPTEHTDGVLPKPTRSSRRLRSSRRTPPLPLRSSRRTKRPGVSVVSCSSDPPAIVSGASQGVRHAVNELVVDPPDLPPPHSVVDPPELGRPGSVVDPPDPPVSTRARRLRETSSVSCAISTSSGTGGWTGGWTGVKYMCPATSSVVATLDVPAASATPADCTLYCTPSDSFASGSRRSFCEAAPDLSASLASEGTVSFCETGPDLSASLAGAGALGCGAAAG